MLLSVKVLALANALLVVGKQYDPCPARCLESGPNSGNWSVYPNFQITSRCEETMFYDFSLFDAVDDVDTNHRISACSSYGSDFYNTRPITAQSHTEIKPVEATLELGWWNEASGIARASIQSIVSQVRDYIHVGSVARDQPLVLYSRSRLATVGIYIGKNLLDKEMSNIALRELRNKINEPNFTAPSFAMQLCGSGHDGTNTFGIMVTSNGTFNQIQDAMKSWINGTCLTFADSVNFANPVTYLSPLLRNGTTAANSTISSNSTLWRNSTMVSRSLLYKRNTCRTVQADSGQGCPELAQKCGITPYDFTRYNPNLDCSKIQVRQSVCCSSGNLPDLRPKKNPNGSCYAYKVQRDDSCSVLAAQFQLTQSDIEGFNKGKTWGWVGCSPLYLDALICLSDGTPPFPAAIPNAICGPQKPGTAAPTDGRDISLMNPCKINACCNIWGQCGVTSEFCTNTSTGNPGTAKPNTNGCISNCGTGIKPGTGNGSVRLAYFQGYGLNRGCLYQDALQIDTSKYTHIHFGFGTLTPTYDVLLGSGRDPLTNYEFNEFKRIRGAKRILSFGGWDFSTMPETYYIFREGVKSANRAKMAQNIANFIIAHELDGVDIDWEYPGAPDLPEFDPGKPGEGLDYLFFLLELKRRLPGKTIAIAAPASYWYLKEFPIASISSVVDYIVYMTYDLHGQWDAHNPWSQENCPTGNCLRSQVNLTETMTALSMITKAGVPGSKILVGVTSYGRSFHMAQAGCWGPNCKFTGDRTNSNASPGRCTGTRGYVGDAEIYEIAGQSSRVTQKFYDSGSASDILVYDNTQWVGYMGENTKQNRQSLYRAIGMMGTSDWASDLQTFHSVPRPAASWSSFKSAIMSGADPKDSTANFGNWKSFTCTAPVIVDPYSQPPEERWKAVDAASAWQQVVHNWYNNDRNRSLSFSESIERTLKAGVSMRCDTTGPGDNCDVLIQCPSSADGPNSGPAAQFIWNSLVNIHKMNHRYRDTLATLVGKFATSADYMENTFAPIPEAKTNQWLNVLIDLLTIGGLGGAAPFFNNFLKTLPYFTKNTVGFDNAKETTMNMIGQITTLSKDLLSAPAADKWTPLEQDRFSHYMGQIVYGWMNSTEYVIKKLFSGEDKYVTVLSNLIRDGKLIDGARDRPLGNDPSAGDLAASLEKAVYGYSIPALWRRSKTYAVVLDSGQDCNVFNPASKYINDTTASSTRVCYDNRVYYLVNPDGDATEIVCVRSSDTGPCQTEVRDRKFSPPTGVDSLPEFGGLTRDDIVIATINTWRYNGQENKKFNFTNMANSDTRTHSAMLNSDVRTPGFVQLPVCSPDRAWQSWRGNAKGGSDFYPCDVVPGKDHCGPSSFTNRVSGASPSIQDCRQIIRNIEADSSTEFTHHITGHREILSYGSCHFGIERTGGPGGTVEFRFGGQDVIDIINESIRQFSIQGRVGSEGVASCSGVTVNTRVDVKWGLY